MSTVAIIAEYNPFHNGHKYHLEQSKHLTGADNAVVVMSGNFVQRGEPAIFNKQVRAEAAIINGLDIVFELPVRFSTASAQDFAYASVEMINSLGIADYLSFGAETDDIKVLQRIADCLTKESVSFKAALNDYLKDGYSFPKARSLALGEELGEQYLEIISTPNNILAIEYLSALAKLDSNIKPIVVKRFGVEHDSEMTASKYASGKMIRRLMSANDRSISTYIPKASYSDNYISSFLRKARNNENMDPNTADTAICTGIKDTSANKYSGIYDDMNAIFSTDIEPLINHELIKLQNNHNNSSDYDSILDISPDIMNKLRKLSLPAAYEEIIDGLKSKELTRSRICRVLIHLLLDIKDIKDGLCCPYATLLALRKESSKLLRTINEKANINIINKRSDYKPNSEYAAKLYIYDFYATYIYNLLYFNKTGIRLPNELSSNVVVL